MAPMVRPSGTPCIAYSVVSSTRFQNSDSTPSCAKNQHTESRFVNIRTAGSHTVTNVILTMLYRSIKFGGRRQATRRTGQVWTCKAAACARQGRLQLMVPAISLAPPHMLCQQGRMQMHALVISVSGGGKGHAEDNKYRAERSAASTTCCTRETNKASCVLLLTAAAGEMTYERFGWHVPL